MWTVHAEKVQALAGAGDRRRKASLRERAGDPHKRTKLIVGRRGRFLPMNPTVSPDVTYLGSKNQLA